MSQPNRSKAQPTGVAFWKDTVFPFLRGGHVTSRDDAGTATAHEYGAHRFKVKFELSSPVGEALMSALDDLEADYFMHLHELERAFRSKATDTVKRYQRLDADKGK